MLLKFNHEKNQFERVEKLDEEAERIIRKAEMRSYWMQLAITMPAFVLLYYASGELRIENKTIIIACIIWTVFVDRIAERFREDLQP